MRLALGKLGFVFLVSCTLALTPAIVQAASAPSDKDGEAMPDPTTAASNPLSDTGTSGLFLYRRHCQSCHGHLGAGTDKLAPLLGSKYSKSHTARKTFHREFRRSSKDHIAVARGTRKNPGPRFNQLELIGKFLREIEAWHVLLDSNNTEK